jgi:hypothetical protein
VPEYGASVKKGDIAEISTRKKDRNIRVFPAFLGTGWVKAWAKIDRDFRARGGHSLTLKSGVFRQTGLVYGPFST